MLFSDSIAPKKIPLSEKEIIIEPPGRWMKLDLGEMWQYRELFLFLVWRDLKVRYRQTALGFSWALLVPFIQIVVFTFLFTYVARMGTNGIPGPAFYFAALVPWNYFSSSVVNSSNSLVGNASFLTRIYIPRLIIPTVPSIAGLVDFLIAFSMLGGIMAVYHIPPNPALAIIPLLVFLIMLNALGMGYLLSSLNVRYRDIRHATPFVMQIWMFLTVVAPFSEIPEKYGLLRYAYGLNPLAGIVEGFRWCLFNARMNPDSAGELPSFLILLALGMPVTIGFLAAGIFSFKRMERIFADTI